MHQFGASQQTSVWKLARELNPRRPTSTVISLDGLAGEQLADSFINSITELGSARAANPTRKAPSDRSTC